MDQSKKSDSKGTGLFPEFPPITTAEWEEVIKRDLKGADYEKKLVWKTYQGFDVKPYYRAENLKDLEYLNSMPGSYPFLRGNKKDSNNWEIRHDIDITDIEEANKIAVTAITKGANGVGFDAKNVKTQNQMSQLLRGIDIEKTSIHFLSSESYIETAKLFINEAKNRNVDTANINGSLNFDPIGYYVLHGDFYNNFDENISEAVSLIKLISDKLPLFKVITVNGQHFHNAGANIVQVLPYTLAAANEYLANLTERGLSIDMIASKMHFVFAISANYFMEIAKLRVARMLWAKIVEQYHPEEEKSMQMTIHTTSSLWNKTLFDPYVNMLRNTTEAMSAIIGGTDSMTVTPFNSVYSRPDEFSRRISQNVQLLLKEESYLNKIVDPSAGSYYLETLTDEIAKVSWQVFQFIEDEGGFIKQFKTGYIHNEINKVCKQRDKDIATRKISILGTNQFPNLSEEMLDKIQEGSEEESETGGLKIYRGSEEYEELRLATEIYKRKTGKEPTVFLLTMGSLAMRKARAMFSTNFFGCAGYRIIDNNLFETVEEGVEAVVDSNADIVVICSSDDDYPSIGPPLCKAIKDKNSNVSVIIAGYPKNSIKDLTSAGIDDFIHIKSNVLETLKKYHVKLGII